MRSSLPPEFTNSAPGSDASASACVNASPNVPSISMIVPPTARTCTSFDDAIAPAGTTITASIPARAAYAEDDAAVFPVDAHTSRVTPRSNARDTASAIPRSLNDPVGFAPSHLSHNSTPNRSESRGAARSGVLPSPSVITRPSLLRCDCGEQELGDLNRVEGSALDEVVAG